MSAPTWWLVITRPSAETNEPEPPLLNRTADDRRCSIHPGVGAKPYLSWSCLSGRLLKTHIPSSAHTIPVPPRAMAAKMARAALARRRVMETGSSMIDPAFSSQLLFPGDHPFLDGR